MRSQQCSAKDWLKWIENVINEKPLLHVVVEMKYMNRKKKQKKKYYAILKEKYTASKKAQYKILIYIM